VGLPAPSVGLPAPQGKALHPRPGRQGVGRGDADPLESSRLPATTTLGNDLPHGVWHLAAPPRVSSLGLESLSLTCAISLFGRLAAAVVARGGLHLGVADEFLHRAKVGSGVQQIGDERAPQIVGGREVGHARLLAAARHVQRRLGRSADARGVSSALKPCMNLLG